MIWRTLKLLLLTFVGCAWADRGLTPGPVPIVGMSVGAATNAVLLAAKAPWWARLGTVVAIGGVGRFVAPKWEGIHLEVTFGAGAAEWASWFVCKGPCR